MMTGKMFKFKITPGEGGDDAALFAIELAEIIAKSAGPGDCL